MLVGLPGVKPDRMIRRFVADALAVDEAAVSEAEARRLVTAAAARLGVGLSDLDYAIWLHQSGSKPT
jgi:predicted nuclease of restriction endonuclease-like RecB superfamily